MFVGLGYITSLYQLQSLFTVEFGRDTYKVN